MKKLVILLIILILLYHTALANSLKIGYLAPSTGDFSKLSSSFLNGLSLSIPETTSITVQDSNNDIEQSLESLYLSGVDVVIGPFLAKNVNKTEKILCKSGIVTILPFARPQYNCQNVFTYNYDPTKATRQLANSICSDNATSVLILFSYDNLNIIKKNAFMNNFKDCNKHYTVEGFQKKSSYDSLIKSIFGVKKIKEESIFSSEDVFIHSNYVDDVVIFAPQDDALSIINLMNYYDVTPYKIFTSDIAINRQLLSISKDVLTNINIITPYYPCSKNKINREFVKKYQEEYKENPDFMAALGFDIGRIIKDSDRISLEARLRNMSDFNGLIGRMLFFDDQGKALIDYKELNYGDIKRCKKYLLKK
jgi:ABC-type branched-subunit amino acid transport system substrate-binding protein